MVERKNVNGIVAAVKKNVTVAEKMLHERDGLVKRLDKIDNSILNLVNSANGRNVVRSGKKRGPKLGTKKIKQNPLPTFILKVMKSGKQMSPKEITEKVRKTGYKTQQKNLTNFRSTVGAVLRDLKGIRRAGRAKYVYKPVVVVKKRSVSKVSQVTEKKEKEEKTAVVA